MAEDNISNDITIHAIVDRSDSNRRLVSELYPNSCSVEQTNIDAYPCKQYSNDVSLNTPTNTVNILLSNRLENIHCNNMATNERTEKSTFKVTALIHNEPTTVGQLNPPAALRFTTARSDATKRSSLNANEIHSHQRDIRLRDSLKSYKINAQTVREKLSRYAYQNKTTKNVTFVLKADEDATNNVEMEGPASYSSSITSVGPEPAQQRSYTNLQEALPQRTIRQGTRRLQQTEETQSMPTEEEMRTYQVPEKEANIWRLYEHQLRLVGRSTARINQLTQQLETQNPPSWCFGGSQAPQYMRPFHRDLVNLTLSHAMQMATTAKNILSRQAERDAGEARHLKDTLQRMYREDRDPNFELATGRAKGIAAHYSRKEQALNARLDEDDQVNIPQSLSDWADQLGRRRVVKPSSRTRSRSKSRDGNKAPPPNKGKPQNPAKQQKQNPNNQANSARPKKNPNHQQANNNKPVKQNNKKASNPDARGSNSNTYTAPRPGPSNTSYTNSRYQPTRDQANNAGPSSSYTQVPLNMNDEEQRLIMWLRASKKNSNK